MFTSARCILGLLAAVLLSSGPALAGVKPFPPSFKIQELANGAVKLHVRVGGKGPAAVLLHGFGDTGDMWQPLEEAPEATVAAIRSFLTRN